MSEKCLVATSLAILLCHPNSSIKCFKPKSNSPKRDPEKCSKSCKRENSGVDDSGTGTEAGNFSFRVLESMLLHQRWTSERKIKIEKAVKVKLSLEVFRKFEQFRGTVKAKAEREARIDGNKNVKMMKERLMADGNELLCFRGTRITCPMGSNGESDTCNGGYCGVCRFIEGVGLSTFDQIYPVTVHRDIRRAHKRAARKCDEYGAEARKAFVLCRVIAGCIVKFDDYKNNATEGVDSVSVSAKTQLDDKLLVLNPVALLPCFVIIYNVE